MRIIEKKLESKVAIVTGAARGIGLAVAETYAAHGCNVVLADLDKNAVESAAENIVKSFGVSALPLQVNVGSYDSNKLMVEQAVEKFGHVDILVCNAGIVRKAKAIEEIPPEDWAAVIDVNLLSCVHATSLFAPYAKNQRSGRIIYMASVAGQVGGVAAEMTYSVTKAGVLCLTKTVAKQLGEFNVTVNAIAPGTIVTAMTDVLQYSPEVKASIPLRAYGDVQDIAEAALYLASDSAKYITGATLDVNGGLSMR
ncbi:SDR family NAD(P)-dependent oxidoreductase [Pseudomonas putida]|uniref:SDR family NAD(P)-dependent oxidoreductase n=1 Tax=Pseudomonas putida TaxID=303 RepID=UPI002DBECA90|nr:SDR family NAD(P)-dependent oxidoreductase [Pseudomonas putida]WRW04778.1 SDR family NAD(P)-dependent oxidoreductase [Pseudomonas putida]